MVELFVPPAKVAAAKQEASVLPQLALTKLDTQWLQVHCELGKISIKIGVSALSKCLIHMYMYVGSE